MHYIANHATRGRRYQRENVVYLNAHNVGKTNGQSRCNSCRSRIKVHHNCRQFKQFLFKRQFPISVHVHVEMKQKRWPELGGGFSCRKKDREEIAGYKSKSIEP